MRSSFGVVASSVVVLALSSVAQADVLSGAPPMGMQTMPPSSSPNSPGGAQPGPQPDMNGPPVFDNGTHVAVDANAGSSARAEPPPRWRTSIGAHVAEYNALAPTDVFGALLFLDVSRDGGMWSPGYRISVARTLPRRLDSDVGNADYTWTLGQLDLCPMRVSLVPEVTLRPCAVVQGGVVQAKGQSGPSPHSKTRPWAGLGALLRVRWAIGDVFALEAQAGVSGSLVRDEFGFGDATAYQPDLWIPFGSIGAGVVF